MHQIYTLLQSYHTLLARTRRLPVRIHGRHLPVVWTIKTDRPLQGPSGVRCAGRRKQYPRGSPAVRLGPGLYRSPADRGRDALFFDEARSLGNEVARLTRRYGSPGLPRLRVARLLRHLALARKDGGNNGQLVSLLVFSLLSSGAFRLGFGRLVVLCGPHVSSGSWEPPVVWLRSTLHLLRRSSSCRAQSTCVSSATSCVPLPAPSFDRSGACAKAWTLAHWRTGAHAA